MVYNHTSAISDLLVLLEGREDVCRCKEWNDNPIYMAPTKSKSQYRLIILSF